MLLSTAEIRDLTGRTHYDAQAKAMRGMGIVHKVRPDGTIAVSRAHVERVLGGEIGSGVRIKKTEPDFSGMKA